MKGAGSIRFDQTIDKDHDHDLLDVSPSQTPTKEVETYLTCKTVFPVYSSRLGTAKVQN